MRSALEHFAQHQRVVEGSLQTEQRALAPPCHPTTSRMSMSECWPLQTRGERRSPGEYGEAAGRLLEGAPRADELAPGTCGEGQALLWRALLRVSLRHALDRLAACRDERVHLQNGGEA